MASSPVTAPSPDTPSSPTPPSSSSSPPPPPAASSPPPATPPSPSPPSPPPPPPTPASPPPQVSSPPPSNNSSSPSPPPPSNNSSSPPPPPPPNNSSPSPPPSSSNNSTTPSSPSNGVPPPPPPRSRSTPPPPHAPPPPRRTPPSSQTPSRSNSTPSNDNFTSQKLPIIIGVTAGVAILIIIMIVIFVCCSKKKKRRQHDPMRYYRDTSGGPNGNEYYNTMQNWNHSSQSMDHVVKAPPPPGSNGLGGGGWAPPPPPPLIINSSEVSSNFSGPRQPVLPPPSPNIALGFNKSTFSFDELAAATGGFSQANLLGQGGFGYVHKGVLPNGKVIAVKSLKSGSGQGEREFQAEVEIISRVHHRHLVSLVGYCIAGGQRMLVYEFVPNKTLEYHLHGNGRPTMDWSKRLTIALGSAKGLAYLHEDCHPRIIHRDIKAANILIDDNFEAMVADFGLAKLSSDNYTHVSTRVMGTFGYLAPEYASSGKLTEKSDVFSYGIMLLELITGRPPVDTTNAYVEDSLVDWARPILNSALGDGNYDNLVDPRLENNYNPSEMGRMVACAAACIRHSGRRRPKMSQIVRALEGDVSLEDLNEGVRPGQSSVFGSTGSSEYDTGSYNADMKKFKKMALSSQEFASSEYSGPSSTEGANSREINRNGNQRLSP